MSEEDLAKAMAAVVGDAPSPEFVSSLRARLNEELTDHPPDFDDVEDVTFIELRPYQEKPQMTKQQVSKKWYIGTVAAAAAAAMVVAGIAAAVDDDGGPVSESAEQPAEEVPEEVTVKPIDWSIRLNDPGWPAGVHSIYTIAEVRHQGVALNGWSHGRLVWDDGTTVELCSVGVREIGTGYVHIGDGFQTSKGCGDDPDAMQNAFDRLGPPKEACVGIDASSDVYEYCGPLKVR